MAVLWVVSFHFDVVHSENGHSPTYTILAIA